METSFSSEALGKRWIGRGRGEKRHQRVGIGARECAERGERERGSSDERAWESERAPHAIGRGGMRERGNEREREREGGGECTLSLYDGSRERDTQTAHEEATRLHFHSCSNAPRPKNARGIPFFFSHLKSASQY